MNPLGMEIVVRYLHFVSILALVGAIMAQHWLMKPSIQRREIVLLQRIDIVYGLSAIVVLLTGMSLWLWVGKPAEFYTQNPVFHVKFTLFLVVGLLSIYPSIYLARNRKGNQDDVVSLPRSLPWLVRSELLLVFAMPLLASTMARGIGITAN